MSLIRLSLETLKTLDDGKPALAFDRQLEAAIFDCLNRPTDDRPRNVTMELVIVPVAEETEVPGNFVCTGVNCQFKTKTKVPVRQTKAYSFGLDKQGRLFFSEQSPTNVNQTTIDDIDPKTHRVVRDVK